MADILSQEEINALVEAYKASGEQDVGAKALEKQVRPYDFARPDRFSRDHLKAIKNIHAKHANSVGAALSSLMRVPVHIELLAVDQLTFAEYQASLPVGTLYVETALESLSDKSIFEFNPSLVSTCVDILAGAQPGSTQVSITVTDIDVAIMRPVLDTVLREYAAAWSETATIRPRIIATTTDLSTRQVFFPAEPMLVCIYEVSIAGVASLASICIPEASLDRVVPELEVGGRVASKQQKRLRVNDAIRIAFDDVTLKCKAILGCTTLSMGELANLEPGDLIRLPTKAQGKLEFWIENVPAYKGTMGTIGGNVALRITDTLERRRGKAA
jgi:flagellar motor switch protein FliM